jgi:hypothetical protein
LQYPVKLLVVKLVQRTVELAQHEIGQRRATQFWSGARAFDGWIPHKLVLIFKNNWFS